MSKAVVVSMGGQTLLVETDDTVEVPARVIVEAPAGADSGDGTDRPLPEGAREVRVIEGIERSFADVKDVIVACCNNLHNAVNSIPRPEKFAIEFGVKLAGETGVPMLTKASGEANFKITVEWKKSEA